jgi:translocation and assembly module TamB
MFDGNIALRGGTFLVPYLGTRFTGLDTELVFEPEAMVVPEFHVLDENGHPLRVAGRLPYRAGQSGEVTIAVDSDDFEIVDNDEADIHVSTDLSVSGTLFAPRLEGSVRATEAHVRIDRILDLRGDSYYRVAPREGESATEGQSTTDGADRRKEPSGLLANAPIALDVTLQMPALLITGRDLPGPSGVPIGLGDVNLTVEGTLELDKAKNEAVIITGDISTVRGTYEFQGRRFDVARDGMVSFPGLVEINPSLDVTARRTISGVETQVRIHGTLRTPALTLTSQPPLDEADILSLLIFNQPANELGASEQVSLGQRAAALAAGFVATKLGRSLGGALDLDLLEIEAGQTAGDGLAPSITLGEQLGENLFVKVRQQFGPSSESEFALEYEFVDWLRLQTTLSDPGNESQSPFRRGEQTGLNWIFSFSY